MLVHTIYKLLVFQKALKKTAEDDHKTLQHLGTRLTRRSGHDHDEITVGTSIDYILGGEYIGTSVHCCMDLQHSKVEDVVTSNLTAILQSHQTQTKICT